MSKKFLGKDIVRNKKTVIVLIIIILTALLGGLLFYKIIQLNRSIDALENRLSELDGKYNGQIQNAKYELEETLKEKESIITSYSLEPITRKIKDGTLIFRVNIVPKIYTEGMSAELSIYGEENYNYKLNYKERAYTAEIPLNIDETEVNFTVHFNDGKKVISQVIDIPSDIVTEYVMEVSYSNNLSMSQSNNKLKIDGEVVINYSPLYASGDEIKAVNYPVSGNVIIKRNGANILSQNIEFQDISNGQYFDCNDYVELDLSIEDYKDSDKIELFAKVVDNFGNITEKKIDELEY